MSSSSSSMNREYILGIQKAIVGTCKRFEEFKEKFLKDGFHYTVLGEQSEKMDELSEIDLEALDYLEDLGEEDAERLKKIYKKIRKYLDHYGFERAVNKGWSYKGIYVYDDYSFFMGREGNITDSDGFVLVYSDDRLGGLNYGKICVEDFQGTVDTSSEGVNLDFGKVLAYDFGVAENIIGSDYEYNEGYEDSYFIGTFIKTVDLDECIPNIIKLKYKWFKILESKRIGQILYRALSRVENNCGFGGEGAYVAHIHMVGDELVWSIHSNEGVEHFDLKTGDRGIPHIGEYSEMLLKEFERLSGIEVKEVYVINNEYRNMKGKMIYRRNVDGEYTITVY